MLEQRMGHALTASTHNGENAMRLSVTSLPSHCIFLFALILVSVGAVGCTAASMNLENSQETLQPAQAEETFAMRVVTTGLENPLEILYGPDGYLWVTE